MLVTSDGTVALHPCNDNDANFNGSTLRHAKYIVDTPDVLTNYPYNHNNKKECNLGVFGQQNYGFEQSFSDITQEEDDLHTDQKSCNTFQRALEKELDEDAVDYDPLDPFGVTQTFDPGYVSERSGCESDSCSDEDDEDEEEGEDEENELDDDEEVSSYSSNTRSSVIEGTDGALLTTEFLMKICPFINKNTLFMVRISKNSRGLGLAVSGGIESTGSWPGLIRIKKIYPQTPAWLTGLLVENDIVLEVNGRPLTGLTSNEALEVLRTIGNEVSLILCRPPQGTLELNSSETSGDRSIVTTSLTAPQPIFGHHLTPSPSVTSNYGEFEVRLRKVAGSLGFTLRKQDNSILGHTIRSLVKEPAISDGRMRPGDKLLSVNGNDMCGLTHEEAVAFLRTCPEEVIIRLYRDALQTPVSPASPVETHFIAPKPLRQEAMDMLSDLAYRRKTSLNTKEERTRRRIGNKDKTPSPDIKLCKNDRWESLVRDAESSSPSDYANYIHRDISPFDSQPSSSATGSPTSSRSGTLISSRNSSDTRSHSPNSIIHSYKPTTPKVHQRPNFLDLSNISSTSKPRISPPSEEDDTPEDYELDSRFDFLVGSSDDIPYPDPEERLFKSMDAANLIGSAHSAVSDSVFSTIDPLSRSINLGCFRSNSSENTQLTGNRSDNQNLVKWKGVLFSPDKSSENEDQEVSFTSSHACDSENDADLSLQPQVLVIQLKRGWNSRLGFSLKQHDGKTLVVAVHENSVAEKDGRLKVGDQLIKVNDEDVSEWTTEEVIDSLRKIRGKVTLALLQE